MIKENIFPSQGLEVNLESFFYFYSTLVHYVFYPFRFTERLIEKDVMYMQIACATSAIQPKCVYHVLRHKRTSYTDFEKHCKYNIFDNYP
jgi:hypothetical protein